MDTKTQILYIDDEPVNLLLFSKLLADEENEIFIAPNAGEGLEILMQKPEIKVVFCDFQMPEMDGIEFISKAKVLYPEKRFYLLTSYSKNNKIQQAIENKLIDGFFQKPFNKQKIISVIDRYEFVNKG